MNSAYVTGDRVISVFNFLSAITALCYVGEYLCSRIDTYIFKNLFVFITYLYVCIHVFQYMYHLETEHKRRRNFEEKGKTNVAQC